jgi:hypothetical protein
MLEREAPAPRDGGSRDDIGHADYRPDIATAQVAQLAPDAAAAAGWGDTPSPPKRTAARGGAADLHIITKKPSDAGGIASNHRRRIVQARLIKIARQWLDPAGRR